MILTIGKRLSLELVSVNLPKPEVIVDELLLKGCIHVWAGMFESYKTMATIELCAAILDNRPAFDHFTVTKAISDCLPVS